MATVVEYGEDPWVKALRESIVSSSQSIAENIGRNKMMQHNAAKAAADRAHRTYLEQMGIASREKLAKSESIALERHREFGRDLSRKEQAQKEKEWNHAKKIRALNLKSTEQQIKLQQHDLQARENEQQVQDGFDFFRNMYEDNENYKFDSTKNRYVWDPISQTLDHVGRKFAQGQHNTLVKANRDLIKLGTGESRQLFRDNEAKLKARRDFTVGALNWLETQKDNTASPVYPVLEGMNYKKLELPQKIAYIHSEGFSLLQKMHPDIIKAIATRVSTDPPKHVVDTQNDYAKLTGFYHAFTDPGRTTLEVGSKNWRRGSDMAYLLKDYLGKNGVGQWTTASPESAATIERTLQVTNENWGTTLPNSKKLVGDLLMSEMLNFRIATGFFPRAGSVHAIKERSAIDTRMNGLYQAMKAEINGFLKTPAYRDKLEAAGEEGVKQDKDLLLEDILGDKYITGFLEDYGEAKPGARTSDKFKKQDIFLLSQVLRGNYQIGEESSLGGNRPSELLLLSLLQDGSFQGKLPDFWYHVHDFSASSKDKTSVLGKAPMTAAEKFELINSATNLQGIRDFRKLFEGEEQARSGVPVELASFTPDSQGNQPGGLIDDSEAYVQSVLGTNRNDLDRIWQPMANAYNLTPKQQSDMRLYLTKDWAKESRKNSNAYPPIPAGYKMQELEDDLLNDSTLGKAIKRSIQANLPVNAKTGFKDVGLPDDPGLNSQEKIYHGFKSLARLIAIKGLMRDEAGKPQGQIPLFIKQLRRDDEGNPRGLTREDFKSIMATWPVETRVKLQKYLDFIKSFSSVDKTGERDFINILNHLAGKEGIPLEDDV